MTFLALTVSYKGSERYNSALATMKITLEAMY